MQLERLHEYGFRQLSLEDDALDGPFLMGDGKFGLLVSLRGRDGGRMPAPGELYWLRDLPPAVRGEPVHVLLRRNANVLYLGTARVVRRGQPARDGFKLALGLSEPLDEAQWRDLVGEANRPLPPAPEETIAALSADSTTADRIAAMRVFAERWFDCPGDAPAAVLDIPVPPPLRHLYALVADREVCVQNRVVKPEQLEVGDDKIVFYVENQGVCVWAIEPAGDDPPVFVKQNEWNAPWIRETDTLSGFLIQMLVQEAVFGAPFGASHDGVEARELAKLTRRIVPLPLPSWASSKARFFGSNGVIGFAFDNGGAFDVWLGAKDRVRLEPIEELVSEWTNVGF